MQLYKKKLKGTAMPAKVSILDHISQEEYKRMMVCFRAIERNYMPGEIITTFGQGSALVGILLDGEAVVIPRLG